MKIFALALIVFSAPFCFAEKLIYYSPMPQFEMEKSAKDLVLRSALHTLKITLKPCNQQVVNQFWKSARKNFEQYPAVRGTPKSEFAEWDGKRRMVLTRLQKNRLRTIEQDFLSLFAMEKKLCKS